MRLALLTCATLSVCLTTSAGAQAADRPQGRPDSIVLTRKDDLCEGGCRPMPAVRLRRADLPDGALEFVVTRAAAAGFYDLPAELFGQVAWCQIALSDARMAVLTIYHADGFKSVRGYHHCFGSRSSANGSAPPRERQQLIALEALVDSVATASPRR